MACLPRFAVPLAVVAAATLVFPPDAHAYLDPGTGSYVLQLVLASVLGGMFAIKLFWKNINGFFSNVFHRQREKEESDENPYDE